MNDDMYEDENGNWVMSSQFLRKRPHCCKSNCLHCPFGTTVRVLGFEFEQVLQSELAQANKLIESIKGDDFTSSLLAGAFGKTEKKNLANKENFHNFYYVFLKNVKCAIIEIDQTKVKELYLISHFSDQGITKDNVENSFNEKLADHLK